MLVFLVKALMTLYLDGYKLGSSGNVMSLSDPVCNMVLVYML
jgi:hypothetical protein